MNELEQKERKVREKPASKNAKLKKALNELKTAEEAITRTQEVVREYEKIRGMKRGTV